MSLYVVDGYWVNGYTVTEQLYGRAWWLKQRPKAPPTKRKPPVLEQADPEPEDPPNPQEIPAVFGSLALNPPTMPRPESRGSPVAETLADRFKK